MSEKTEIKVDAKEGVNEIIIRQGDASPAMQPRTSVSVYGTLGVVIEHLRKLPKEVTEIQGDAVDTVLAHSYVEVDKDNGVLKFVQNAGDEHKSIYKGSLEVDKKFKDFGINSSKSYTTFELADFIKMNRTYFDTKEIAMKLVSELRNFKAKVDKQLEQSENNRGDKRFLIAQVVDSNIPETFNLTLPIFKGYDKRRITVEVAIDSGDFSCKLISPEAADIIEELRDELLMEQVEKIKELHPGLRIFNI